MDIQELQNRLPMLEIEDAVENYFGEFESYRSYLGSFLKLYGDCLENMVTAYEEKNWDKLRIPVHKIKSSTGLLGGTNLMKTAAELEKATVDKNSSAIEKLYPNLLSQMKTFIESLDKIEPVMTEV